MIHDALQLAKGGRLDVAAQLPSFAVQQAQSTIKTLTKYQQKSEAAIKSKGDVDDMWDLNTIAEDCSLAADNLSLLQKYLQTAASQTK